MCDKYGNYIGEGFSEEDSVFSDSTESTVFTTTLAKKHNKDLQNAKTMDMGYNKFSVVQTKIVDGRSIKKRANLELYTSTLTPGSLIRSAVGGAYHSGYIVGKSDEYIFFKVGICTGECKGDSNTMFFDTPEQYEKLFDVELSPTVKKNWYERFNQEKKYREERANLELSKTHIVCK